MTQDSDLYITIDPIYRHRHVEQSIMKINIQMERLHQILPKLFGYISIQISRKKAEIFKSDIYFEKL